MKLIKSRVSTVLVILLALTTNLYTYGESVRMSRVIPEEVEEEDLDPDISSSADKPLDDPSSTVIITSSESDSKEMSSLKLGDRVEACEMNATFYSYMPYQALSTKSVQSQFSRGDDSWTDSRGIRYHGDYMLVALASMYGPYGTKYRVTFSDGSTLLIMKGDEKSSSQTTCTHGDGSLIEVIIDNHKLSKYWKSQGTLHGLLFEGSPVGTIYPLYFEEVVE